MLADLRGMYPNRSARALLCSIGEHGGVKRSTAIRHLVEMGTEANDMLRFRETDFGWPLEEMWVAGELLETDGEVEASSVILLLDVPPVELPWNAIHPAGEWVGERLRLDKRPTHWFYRPMVWPAWNVLHRRVARIWSATAGLDEAAIEALRSGGTLQITEPTNDELLSQLTEERQASYAHLRRITDNYWDREWRRDNRGNAAQEQLHRAAAALIKLDDALADLNSSNNQTAASSAPER